MNLETILNSISEQLAVFDADSKKHLAGNKAAGARARKASVRKDYEEDNA